MKFGRDIHVPQRMDPNDFGDPLTFPLESPAGQISHIFREIAWHLEDVLAQKLVQILIILVVTSFYSLGFTRALNLFVVYSRFMKNYVKVLM